MKRQTIAHLSLALCVFGTLKVHAADFLFIGLTNATKAEIQGGALPDKSKAYYLQQLNSAPNLPKDTKFEFVGYYELGNMIKLRVEKGPAREIAQTIEAAKLPFIKFVDYVSKPEAEREKK